MSNLTLNTLLRDYEQKKYKAELDFEKEKSNFYAANPKLTELTNKLGKLALDASKAVLDGNTELAQKLRDDFDKLKQEKTDLLNSIDVPKGALEPLYECPICKDSGFIKDGRKKSVLCNCIKQKIFDINFNNANIGNLEKENFDTFNLELYSDKVDTEKYRSKISPRQNIINIMQIVNKFIKNFDSPNAKNLLFTGNTGLGKTFLSNCIAKEILRFR